MIWPAFRRPTFWILAAIVAAGAFVRFCALDFGLPHTQARPDETAIIDPVRVLLSGRLPQFYDYPWLFLWLLAAAYLTYFACGFALGRFGSVADMLASWPTHYEPFFLIPRAISAALGTATIAVVYRLGRQVRDEATGIIAAIFLALTFIHARSSHFGTTDITMTFLIVIAITLLMDAHRTRSRRTFTAAGLASGLAVATKYSAVVLVVPMLVSHLLTVLDSPRATRRAAWRDTRILFFGGAFALALSVGIPFILLDQERFFAAMRELVYALRVGDKHLPTGNGWVHHLIFSLRYGLGMPLLVTGLAGAVLLLWRDPRLGALFLSFPISYYVVAGSLKLLFFRYTMPIVPFLSVTAGYLVSCLATLAVRRLSHRRARRLVWGAACTVATVAILWTSATRTWAFNRVLGRADSRVLVVKWFVENVPPGSTIVQSGSLYGRARFAGDLGYREWRWDGMRLAFVLDGKRLSAADAPDWIIIQDSPLPSTTQEILKTLIEDRYMLAHDLKAFSASRDLVYDQQDMFFVPFSGFQHVVRPGPNFSVFRRKDVTNGEARARTE
jgi:hypothetical protein